MRKLILAVLLASAATPAFAAATQRSERLDEARSERSERADSEREQRGEARQERRQAQQERREQARQETRSQPSERRDRQRTAPIQREQQREAARPARREPGPRLATPAGREQRGDSVRDWRSGERRRADSPSAVQERNLRRAPGVARSGEDRSAPGVTSRRPVPGMAAPEPETARLAHARPDREWRSDWRRDSRYDWSDYRRRNHRLFRPGLYVDPFGWGYSRFNAGWRLWPSYYSNRYWLNDPWSYRLPPAYGPYRWVRYWDDALLVNIYTGRVVDVVHNFFW